MKFELTVEKIEASLLIVFIFYGEVWQLYITHIEHFTIDHVNIIMNFNR